MWALGCVALELLTGRDWFEEYWLQHYHNSDGKVDRLRRKLGPATAAAARLLAERGVSDEGVSFLLVLFESGRGNEAGRGFDQSNRDARLVRNVAPQTTATHPGAPIDAGEAPAQGPETTRRHAVGVADARAHDAHGPAAQVLPHAARVAAAGRRLKNKTCLSPLLPVPPPPRLVSTEQRCCNDRCRRGNGDGCYAPSLPAAVSIISETGSLMHRVKHITRTHAGDLLRLVKQNKGTTRRSARDVPGRRGGSQKPSRRRPGAPPARARSRAPRSRAATRRRALPVKTAARRSRRRAAAAAARRRRTRSRTRRGPPAAARPCRAPPRAATASPRPCTRRRSPPDLRRSQRRRPRRRPVPRRRFWWRTTRAARSDQAPAARPRRRRRRSRRRRRARCVDIQRRAPRPPGARGPSAATRRPRPARPWRRSAASGRRARRSPVTAHLTRPRRLAPATALDARERAPSSHSAPPRVPRGRHYQAALADVLQQFCEDCIIKSERQALVGQQRVDAEHRARAAARFQKSGLAVGGRRFHQPARRPLEHRFYRRDDERARRSIAPVLELQRWSLLELVF